MRAFRIEEREGDAVSGRDCWVGGGGKKEKHRECKGEKCCRKHLYQETEMRLLCWARTPDTWRRRAGESGSVRDITCGGLAFFIATAREEIIARSDFKWISPRHCLMSNSCKKGARGHVYIPIAPTGSGNGVEWLIARSLQSNET